MSALGQKRTSRRSLDHLVGASNQCLRACRQKEVDQQKGSHHAKAGENRAKSDGIDAELLLRTLLAWLRGEPRVCSMVPIPDETDEVPDGVFASGPNSSPSASV
jgi:hypothetical protein